MEVIGRGLRKVVIIYLYMHREIRMPNLGYRLPSFVLQLDKGEMDAREWSRKVRETSKACIAGLLHSFPDPAGYSIKHFSPKLFLSAL